MEEPRELVPFNLERAAGAVWIVAVTRTAIDDGLAMEGGVPRATSLKQQLDWVHRESVKLAELAVSKIEAGLVDQRFVYITAADWAGR